MEGLRYYITLRFFSLIQSFFIYIAFGIGRWNNNVIGKTKKQPTPPHSSFFFVAAQQYILYLQWQSCMHDGKCQPDNRFNFLLHQ